MCKKTPFGPWWLPFAALTIGAVLGVIAAPLPALVFGIGVLTGMIYIGVQS